MEAPPTPSLHQHVTLPTLTSLIRLLPLCLLFFLTTPHGLAEHIHAFYSRRPYAKLSPRDPFPSKRGDIHLSELPIPLNLPSQRDHLVLEPGTSLYASIRAPAHCTRASPCAALIEAWYNSKLPREKKPDPYLLAANGTIPQPFPRSPTLRLADDEAFYTWRSYHFIRIPSMAAQDDWHLRLFNHDSDVFNSLNATLRVTIFNNTNANTNNTNTAASSSSRLLCPRGPGRSPCSGRGTCNANGECHCSRNYGGRFCETRVDEMPSGSFEVPPDGRRVFRYIAPRAAHIVTEMRLLPPQAVTSAAHPILFAKRLGENGGRFVKGHRLLSKGPPLPTIYDTAFTDGMAVRTHMLTQRVVTRNVVQGEHIYIAVYNFRASAPAWLVRRHPNLRIKATLQRRAVRVALLVYPCIDTDSYSYVETNEMPDESALKSSLLASSQQLDSRNPRVQPGTASAPKPLRRCPSRATDWEHSMGLLLGPLLLGSLTLMTMVVCVSIWAGVFRQHMLEAMNSMPGGTVSPITAALNITGASTVLGPSATFTGVGAGSGSSNINLDNNNTNNNNNGTVLTFNDGSVGGLPGMNHDRDKLSQEEVDAMFPAFQFTKNVTEALCAVGDASCSVCLCAFEEGEPLRRLPCGHSYHSHCLDRWLVTNASCPRCRMKARISGDIFGRNRFFTRFTSARNAMVSAFSVLSSSMRLSTVVTGENAERDGDHNVDERRSGNSAERDQRQGETNDELMRLASEDSRSGGNSDRSAVTPSRRDSANSIL